MSCVQNTLLSAIPNCMLPCQNTNKRAGSNSKKLERNNKTAGSNRKIPTVIFSGNYTPYRIPILSKYVVHLNMW